MPHPEPLSKDELVLAAATKQAIKAAGGLEDCARETGLSTSQISRCSSRDHRDSLTLRAAVTIDDLSHGAPGAPHILRAFGRLMNCVVIPMPDGPADADGLLQSVMELTAELGDVAQSIRAALSDSVITDREREAALDQLDELDAASATLRLKLKSTDAETAKA